MATGTAVLVVAAGFLAYAVANTGRGGGGGTMLTARFDNAGALPAGAEVRIAGVPVGRVVDSTIDAKTFQAVVRFTIQPTIKLPSDSSATVSTGGLLGSPFLSLAPGGSETDLKDGGQVTITQGATNLEDLLGKFIFNVGSLADATQQRLKQDGPAGGGQPATGPKP